MPWWWRSWWSAPTASSENGWQRNFKGAIIGAVALILAGLVLTAPLLFTSRYARGLLVMAGIYAILTIGFNITLGYAGLISVGHGAFFAIGAYTAAILSTRLQWPFPVGMAAGALGAGLAGALLGLTCLRLRGHYLALATLGFAFIVQLLLRSWRGLTGGSDGIGQIPPPSLGTVTITSRPALYYMVLACVVVLAYAAWRLRNSQHGRALIALRGAEIVAELAGVNTIGRKLQAFVLGAVYAGIAGVLYAHIHGYIGPDIASFDESVLVATMLVIGGMGSVAGAIIGAGFVTFLPEWLRFLGDWYMVVYGLGVIATMIAAPAGLAGLVARLAFTRPKAASASLQAPATAPAPEPIKPVFSHAAWALATEGVTVEFGGLCAVDAATIKVRPGAIHAIIGPNGAGKSTLFNVLSGVYRPRSGAVRILGRSIKGLRPHRIAALGLARTYQNIRLFAGLTVLDNVLVAAETRHPTRLLAAMIGLPAAARAEAKANARAERALQMVGLWERRDAQPQTLPYGDQRLLEIARALAAGPALLLLDEPGAGMNEAETAHLGETIRAIRAEGTTVVLVEHNMDLVMDLADRVTVLDFGRVIADGTPADVQADPTVIAAYLGGGACHVAGGQH